MKISLQECVDLCNYSYDTGICVPKNPVSWFHGTVADGFTTVIDGDLWVVFQGSRGNRDWKADFDMWESHVPYSASRKVRVHTGFFQAYFEPGIRSLIQTEVKHFLDENPGKNVVVLGHSLGAALATFCTLDLQYNYGDQLGSNLYGVALESPRVGNKAFVKSFEKRVGRFIRVKNGADSITHVPPVIAGFRHIPRKLKINHRGFFKLLWNFIKAPFIWLFKWRGPVYDKYTHGNTAGSDLLIFDDHNLWQYNLKSDIQLF